MKKAILIIDDEESVRTGLAENFSLEGYRALSADGPLEGLKLFKAGGVDCIITDLRMGEGGGLSVVREVNQSLDPVPIIVLTAYGSVDVAVEAMRLGAFDFLTKPVNLDALNAVVKRALEVHALTKEKAVLSDKVKDLERTCVELRKKESLGFDKTIIGKSLALEKVFLMIEKAAPTDATVLITGESGTGKELVAHALHARSARGEGPFVAVHSAALPRELLESELFGHEKGSFTGADRRVLGRFELADGGTIFLDEIGEIDAATQVKLLRVLQEREFLRVGGEDLVKVNVRVIAATNKDLEKEVREGRFREDLYYRLAVINIRVPPLRERRSDIPLLIDSFLKKYSMGKKITLDPSARQRLLRYPWPGNIRQLENCIEAACVLCDDSVIKAEDIEPLLIAPKSPDQELWDESLSGGGYKSLSGKPSLSNIKKDLDQKVPESAENKDNYEKKCQTKDGDLMDKKDLCEIALGVPLREVERQYVRETLKYFGGNKSQAARALAVERKTLTRLLKGE